MDKGEIEQGYANFQRKLNRVLRKWELCELERLEEAGERFFALGFDTNRKAGS